MCKYSMKLLPLYSIALGLVLTALLPAIVSFRFLGFQEVAVIGESFLPMTGILLITPLAFCEGPPGRQETLAVRPTPYWKGFLTRLVMMAAVSALFTAAFVLMARMQANAFDAGAMWFGLYATVLLLGSLGLTVGHITRSQPAAYMIPAGIFILEYFTHGKYTGRFFLLSLMDGALRPEKTALFLAACALLAWNVFLSVRQVGLHPLPARPGGYT